MFFIGIFGLDAKHKEIKRVDNILCRNCNQESNAILSKAYKCFHFFYIPIIKYNTMYFLKCDHCNSLHQVKIEKAKNLERGIDQKITIWDLKLISKPSEEGSYSSSICSCCSREINNDYKYCPHCGTSMLLKKDY